MSPIRLHRQLTLICLALAGCAQQHDPPLIPSAHKLEVVHLDDSNTLVPMPADRAIALTTGRNQWTSFIVQIDRASACNGCSLHIAPFSQYDNAGRHQQISVSAYQILPVKVNRSTAQFVRSTGDPGSVELESSALLGVPEKSNTFTLDATAAPSQKSPLVWIDLHIGDTAPPGNYRTTCQLIASGRTVESLPLQITVADFSLPKTPSLQIIKPLDWKTVTSLHPGAFDDIIPRLINRAEPRYASAVATLDQLITLAHENRAEAVIPGLRPTVKWPASGPPQIDWSDFDSLIQPWLSGSMFHDHSHLAYWPMPQPELFENFDSQSRNDYARLAAAHFKKSGWIDHCSLMPTNPSSDPTTVAEQVWLAFLRSASAIISTQPPPSSDSLAEAHAWFYPGQWFGVDHPLASVQLKRARQAEQDFEYLRLMSQRDPDLAQQIAQLIVRPIEIPPDQQVDPTEDLFSGTPDPNAWSQARQILWNHLAIRPAIAPQPAAPEPDTLVTLRWFADQQRPNLLARKVQWLPDKQTDAASLHRIDAKISVDLFNPSPKKTTGGELQWAVLQSGWEVHPQPLNISTLQYGVQHLVIGARFDLDHISTQNQPLQLAFVGGASPLAIPCAFVLPVRISQRRVQEIQLDGTLADWSAADALQLDQPLVRMFDRPSLRRQELLHADTPTSIYSAWSDEELFLAFRLAGVQTADIRSTRNFVDYQSRRAWGEDLAEILIQPIYPDNSTGPLLHLVCKPGGNWVERKSGEDNPTQAWAPLDSAGIRYASGLTTQQQVWRGELAIPWRAISDSSHGRPNFLRFNFVQHQNATGQSASWAGPIDYGRDEQFMGLIYLSENQPGDIANSIH